MVVEQKGAMVDAEEVHGVVEEGQVDAEELEENFEKLHTSIQGLFEKVDRIFAGQDKILARSKYIRNTNLAMLPTAMLPSSCEGCIFPAMCRRCGVRGEASIFRCLACSLPVPNNLLPCEV
jgi:hypothetical protein